MSKKQTDSEKFTNLFFRKLPAPYKLFWEYILMTCDQSGVWVVEEEVAQVRIGKDAKFSIQKALEVFNADKERVYPFKDGEKWLILGYIHFQRGKAIKEDDASPYTKGLINCLKNNGLYQYFNKSTLEFEGLPNPCESLNEGLPNPCARDNINNNNINNNIDINKKEKEEKEKIVQEVVDMFHSCCPSLKRVRQLSEQRKSGILQRLKDMGSMEKLREILELIEKSDYLTGRSKVWLCNFDWIFCCKNNWRKVEAGNYDNIESSDLQVGQKLKTEQTDDIVQKADF